MKTAVILLKLSEDLKEQIRVEADKTEESVSSWLRRIAVEKIVKKEKS